MAGTSTSIATMEDDTMSDNSELTVLDSQQIADLESVNDEDGDIPMLDAESLPLRGVLSENGSGGDFSSPSPKAEAWNGFTSKGELHPSPEVESLKSGKRRKVTESQSARAPSTESDKKSDSQPKGEELRPQSVAYHQVSVQIPARIEKPKRRYVKKSSLYWKSITKEGLTRAKQNSTTKLLHAGITDSLTAEEIEVDGSTESSRNPSPTVAIEHGTVKPKGKSRDRATYTKRVDDNSGTQGANTSVAPNNKVPIANGHALPPVLSNGESARTRRSIRAKAIPTRYREDLENSNAEGPGAGTDGKESHIEPSAAAAKENVIKPKRGARAKAAQTYEDDRSEFHVTAAFGDANSRNLKSKRRSASKSASKVSPRQNSVLLSEIELFQPPIDKAAAGSTPEEDPTQLDETDETEDEIDVHLGSDKTNSVTPPMSARQRNTKNPHLESVSTKEFQAPDDNVEKESDHVKPMTRVAIPEKPARKRVTATLVTNENDEQDESEHPKSTTEASSAKELIGERVDIKQPIDGNDDKEEDKDEKATEQGERRKSTTKASNSKKSIKKQIASDDKKEKGDFEDSPKSTPKKARRGSNSRAAPRRRPPARQNKTWDPIFVITDSKSPLIKLNLITILTDPRAWTTLHPSQQRSLLEHLPPAASAAQTQQESLQIEGTPSEEPLPNIPLQRLQSSSAFQTDVRQFQEDLRAGKLEPAWIEMAMNASARRRAGEFDDWKEKERERVWGFGVGEVVERGGEQFASTDDAAVNTGGGEVEGD